MMITLTFFIIFILIMVLYYLSENHRVNKSLNKLSNYEQQILISNSTY